MSSETNSQSHSEIEPRLEGVASNQNSETPIDVTPNVLGEESALRESFITRRLHQIRSGYENLSDKQKDVLQLGAMALSVNILPIIGVLDHVQASEHFLEWEGLGAYGLLLGAGVVRFKNLAKRDYFRG